MKKLKVKETFNIKGRGKVYLVSYKENGPINVGDKVVVNGEKCVVAFVEKTMNNFGVCDHLGVIVRSDTCE
jgi:hypothetical protein